MIKWSVELSEFCTTFASEHMTPLSTKLTTEQMIHVDGSFNSKGRGDRLLLESNDGVNVGLTPAKDLKATDVNIEENSSFFQRKASCFLTWTFIPLGDHQTYS